MLLDSCEAALSFRQAAREPDRDCRPVLPGSLQLSEPLDERQELRTLAFKRTDCIDPKLTKCHRIIVVQVEQIDREPAGGRVRVHVRTHVAQMLEHDVITGFGTKHPV